MPATTELLIILAGVALLGLMIFAAARLRDAVSRRSSEDIIAEQKRYDTERQLENLAAAHTALTGRLEQLTTTTQSSQAHLMRAVQERLDQIGQSVGQRLTDTSEKTSESLGKLNERLAVIDVAQKNITELSGQVIGLQDILSNKQARGAFGEIQLTDLVKSTLPPSAYEFQATLSNNRRADCLIKLPNPPGPITIDAKFPLEAYQELRAAETPEDQKKAAASFKRSVLKHVLDIAERYIVRDETAESALMFIPSEAVYAELHANFPDVVQESFKARVWIVSPTTMMATLNTVRAVLKDAQMREQAHLIQQEVGRMLEDIGRLGGRVDKLQQHFNQAQRDVSEIATSTGKISRRAEKIDTMQLDDDETPKKSLDVAEETRASAARRTVTPQYGETQSATPPAGE